MVIFLVTKLPALCPPNANWHKSSDRVNKLLYSNAIGYYTTEHGLVKIEIL